MTGIKKIAVSVGTFRKSRHVDSQWMYLCYEVGVFVLLKKRLGTKTLLTDFTRK